MMRRLIPRLVLVAGLLLLAWWALQRMGLLSPADWFKAKPVQIAETPVILKEIRTIAEWQTAKMYAEVVVDTLRYETTDAIQDAFQRVLLPGTNLTGGDRMVVIARGTVKAGINLQQLTEANFQRSGDTITLSLPEAEWLDVVINPSDVTVFTSTGSWPPNTLQALTIKARQALLQEANQQGLRQKANEQARKAMEVLLRGMGLQVR